MAIVYAQTVFGQGAIIKTIDAETKQPVPFVLITNDAWSIQRMSDPRGRAMMDSELEYEFSHPFYNTTKVFVDLKDSINPVELTKNLEIQVSHEQLKEGDSIVKGFHAYLPETSTIYLPEFDYISYSSIDIYQQAMKDLDEWELVNSLESIEKNKFRFPDKRYSRVVNAHFSDGDSSKRGFIPINSYSVSPLTEYIDALDLKFYNPLFADANKRYDYALIETIREPQHSTIYVVYFRPKKNKRFLGLEGLLYFAADRFGNVGGLIFPHKEKLRNFAISYYTEKTAKDTYFLKDLHAMMFLFDIPNLSRKTKVQFTTQYTSPSFNTSSNSNTKWVDMALFDNTKDSIEDDTWLMTQAVDGQKLEYIKKDTTEDGFVLSKTLRWLYNIYEGRLGYRARFFDINNVFAINRFESVRIGIGVQSHENLSDVFTFGGYFGYGIGDGKFKYGGNVGMYFGPTRSHLLSFQYKRDLLEPGNVYYMDKRADLVRNFFTSRMDDYQSGQISIRTRINAYITSQLLLNNYELTPLYDYIYNPNGEEIDEVQTFKFTEASLLLSIGTPFSHNPSFREILYRKKRIRSNLFLNITRGFITDFGGEYDYWKVNGRLSSNIRIGKQDALDIVLDGGAMTPEQPYQIHYVGPGTEFKLTGLIINNAFQTMKLYGFFADRYAHSFINYDLGNIFTKNSKFKPELAFALNLGWGKLKGSKEIHENIEVRDYPEGFYEVGVLFNNLLRLKIYNYFYGGLGIGTFVGFGPDAEDGAFAVRLSYEIGTL